MLGPLRYDRFLIGLYQKHVNLTWVWCKEPMTLRKAGILLISRKLSTVNFIAKR
ncbi:hypothetical protein LMANV2_170146 [Leptospira interrogans serovar Manilae]|uniref:Uncharacterized protein n=1 Tax=Leptospira interrogans serovar Manilae TaxID=214675 RepID=A0AAQ1SMR9_LEPIR|nr:hypothetical protein LMANV2_170146 [Leptospira interrogans serovar Manilae]